VRSKFLRFVKPGFRNLIEKRETTCIARGVLQTLLPLRNISAPSHSKRKWPCSALQQPIDVCCKCITFFRCFEV